MATNICLDCGHFLVCKKAEEHLQECNKFIKVHREIERKDSNERFKDIYK